MGGLGPVGTGTQQHMLKKAKDLHRAWMFTAGLSALLVAVPLALVAAIAYGIAERHGSQGAYVVCYSALALGVTGVAVGPVLLIWRSLSVSRFDPNDAPAEMRIEEGRERALTIEEFAAMI